MYTNKLQTLTKLMKTGDLVGWHHNLFLSILTASPPLDQACYLYIMSVISNYNCMQKDFLGHGGGNKSQKIFFPISYKFNKRNGVFNKYL